MPGVLHRYNQIERRPGNRDKIGSLTKRIIPSFH